jgi:hypothetical protein
MQLPACKKQEHKGGHVVDLPIDLLQSLLATTVVVILVQAQIIRQLLNR